MSKFPMEEMQADLAATDRDIENLTKICEHIDAFIWDSHGENRSNFRADYYKFSQMIVIAKRLRDKIQNTINSATE